MGSTQEKTTGKNHKSIVKMFDICLCTLQTDDEEKNENVSADTEMFILGLLKEQRQEEKDRQRMELVSYMINIDM